MRGDHNYFTSVAQNSRENYISYFIITNTKQFNMAWLELVLEFFQNDMKLQLQIHETNIVRLNDKRATP